MPLAKKDACTELRCVATQHPQGTPPLPTEGLGICLLGSLALHNKDEHLQWSIPAGGSWQPGWLAGWSGPASLALQLLTTSSNGSVSSPLPP